MVIDSSAVVAIALHEPEADRMITAISSSPSSFISVVTQLVWMMVVESRRSRSAADELRLMLEDFDVKPVAFNTELLHEAMDAFRRYGKGRHPAALNIGDCCAYATAISTGQSLLFKGNDFSQTDVLKAEW